MPVPTPEPFRLLKQYPLLCGLFIFTLRKRFHEVSIAFANAWGSILFTGHLYNAARKEKFLLNMWKDMELVIMLQSPEKMFIGDAPSGLENYLKRLLLSLGYSAANFASNRRKGAPIVSPRGPNSLMELGKVSSHFAGRYCNNDKTVSWTSESIKPIIESKMDYDSDDDGDNNEKQTSAQAKVDIAKKTSANVKQSASGALLKRPKREATSISTLDFLSDLANALHAEVLELSVDYLRVHRFCWKLLRQVNETCKPKLLELYGPGYLEKESQLPFVIGHIFMTATTTSRVANLLLPRRGNGEVSSQLLAMAASCIKDMVETGAGEIELKILRDFIGYDIQMDDPDR